MLRRPPIEVCDGTKKLCDETHRLVFTQRTVSDRIRKQHCPDFMRESGGKPFVGQK